MKKIIETERLILRPFNVDDADDVYEFNSNPEVTKYTGELPLKDKSEALKIITDVWYSDYEKYGYGRFAVVFKENNKVIGFSGLKNETELGATDIGYRFLPEYWGKGIATESCLPCLTFGFEDLNLDRIIGLAYPENGASCHILENKLGLNHYKTEPFPGETRLCNWYEIFKQK